ncbi:MAG TPA: hypothetical protein VEB21_12075, partial [Terriglobales bacterium]|nr:hypothetical protein [Terriglobales bacterium]
QRRGLLLRSLPGSWVDPDSEGLDDAQVRAVDGAVRGGRAAVLLTHAPLLHPRGGRARQFALDPGERNGLASQAHFERELFATGHRSGVIFRNSAELIRILASAPGPVSVISGHVHKATGARLDRRRLQAEVCGLVPPQDPSAEVPLFTAPSLGHRRKAHGEWPGYLIATYHDGALVDIERRFVGL